MVTLKTASEVEIVEGGTDRTRAAHFEHTVAITADGPVVLTAP